MLFLSCRPFARNYSPPGVVFLPLADAEVTWKILVMWRRGRAGGALKALLDALFTKIALVIPGARKEKNPLFSVFATSRGKGVLEEKP